MEENTQNKNELKYSQVFDWACKTIMNMSHKSIVNFINGLFQKKHPENSKISFPSTDLSMTGLKNFLQTFSSL